MSTPTFFCVLHLGIHKTGTTFLQKTWEHNLAEPSSLHYIPLKALRSTLTAAIRDAVRQKSQSELCHQQLAASAHWLANKFSSHGALLLSDENLCGTPYKFSQTKGAYPKISNYIKTLISLLPPETHVEICLCVRNYADWIQSSYLQYLKHSKTLAFSRYLDRINTSTLSWLSLIKRIKASAPQASIVVWTYEAFRNDNAAVFAAFAKRFGTQPLSPPANFLNPSLSNIAQKLLVSAGSAGIRKKHATLLVKFCKQHLSAANNYPPAKLMQETLKLELSTRYENDLKLLASAPGVELLLRLDDVPR
jgi:hypothetical protein